MFTPADQANPAVSGETANPANDGIKNLEKYALGLNPYVNSQAGLPTFSLVQQGGQTYPALTFQVPSVDPPTDLLYAPQSTPALSMATVWSTGPGIVDLFTSQAPTTPGGPNLYTYIGTTLPPSAHNKAFMRLQVTETAIISLASGTYTSPQTTTITGPAGATFYYTIDGSTPSSASPQSTLYTTPLTINYSQTLKVQTYLNGVPYGGVAIANYIIILPPMAARVSHAPAINGTVTGNVQQMLGENFSLNSNAAITGDLYVPGVPSFQQNGGSQFQGIQFWTGAATPTNYSVTLNHNAKLRYLIERTDLVTFTAVPNPPTPTGTRDVSVNSASTASATIGTWSTVHNLTLNSNAGAITVPAGSYGAFTANSATSFILGTAGATTPSIYSFDSLNLNSTSSLVVNGPVIIQVRNGVTLNSSSFLGNQQNPSWVSLKITTGGLNINSNGTLYGFVEAPTSTVSINNGKLVGSVISASNLNVNSSGSIQEIIQAL